MDFIVALAIVNTAFLSYLVLKLFFGYLTVNTKSNHKNTKD